MSVRSFASRRRLRRARITGWTSLTALLVTIVSFLTWFHIVLPADRDAVDRVFADPQVSVVASQGLILFTPADEPTSQGLVFYPGAKVDPYSYLPTFHELVAEGLTVVIVEPLFNMALFDTTALSDITGVAPDVSQWFVGGHSLGGVKACMAAQDPAIDGLVTMASFCASDLSARDIPALQLLGDRDGLIDLNAVDEASPLLPERTETTTIAGANHASFGAYGPQAGDGIATTPREDVAAIITAAITAALLNN